MTDTAPENMQGPKLTLPEPLTLEEALARQNFTPEQAWALAVKAKWGFCADGAESPYEYDQGHTLEVEYDDLYNLACIALAAMKLTGYRGDHPAKIARAGT